MASSPVPLGVHTPQPYTPLMPTALGSLHSVPLLSGGGRRGDVGVSPEALVHVLHEALTVRPANGNVDWT